MKISIILYKSKTLADGSHLLIVHISQLKAKKYFSTGLYCPASLWDFDMFSPFREAPSNWLTQHP
ncbi:Arm DNA-binding domain-containing protein [Candidatus Amoebophilus asiaticus]|uniref:Arm DNA-binding domain-containing protein n=1 Tax=Candidatus Amoebophilus asiaticus TaxID=281120 RepID=UPI0001715B12|nr:Arm DNA-binding domain-containing protein [Candidatus Amoebophilus asiaticus]